MRLQKTDAASFLASRAADHLVQQLERALGRARIGIAEAEVRIDDADKGQFRENDGPSRQAACR